MDNTDGEWELSKENIQPLRKGRKMRYLRAALTPRQDEDLMKQRQIFEIELRTYSGDDPIQVWCQYIEWVEQNYPKGGRDGNVSQLLERCIAVLKDNPKYQDDERYLNIWLKYANVSPNILETFNFMHEQNIGLSHADFYISWSWALEQMNDFHRANRVLQEGIDRKAQPEESLLHAKNQLQINFAKAMLENEDVQPSASGTQEQRSVLGALRPQGAKKKVPINRTGSSKLDLRVRLPQTKSSGNNSSNLKKKGNTKAFPIVSDENAVPGTKNQQSLMYECTGVPMQCKESVNIVPIDIKSKENVIRPGKWSKAKLVQKNASALQNSNPTPAFPVLEDAPSSPVRPPVNIPRDSNILSCVRRDKSPVLAVFEPPDPTKIPRYCKYKVYGGGTEFSFEEIRAAKWFALQKQKAKEEKEKAEREDMKMRIKALEEQLAQFQLMYSTPSGSETRSVPSSENAASSEGAANAARANPSSSSQRSLQYDNAQESQTHETESKNYERVLQNNSAMPSPTVNTREAYRMVGELWDGTFRHTSNVDGESLARDGSPNSAATRNNFFVFSEPTQTLSTQNAAGVNGSDNLNLCENEEMEVDENKENVPTPGYIHPQEGVRIKTGILQPSIGIPCGPPNDDEEDEDNDVLEGICPLPADNEGNDMTLAPLCNTQNFAAYPILCSTPFTRSEQPPTCAIDAADSPSKNLLKKPQTPAGHSSKSPIIQVNERDEIRWTMPSAVRNEEAMDARYTVKHNLSTIIETSRENARSSCSSSGCQSVSSSDRTSSSSTSHCISKSLQDSSGRNSRSVLSNSRHQSSHMLTNDNESHLACGRRGELTNASLLNPFDSSDKENFLNHLDFPLMQHEGYIEKSTNVPVLRPDHSFHIGGDTYIIKSRFGKGASGKIYLAYMENSNISFDEENECCYVILKVANPLSKWEFYVCEELHARLAKLHHTPCIAKSIVKIPKCISYPKGCILIEEFCQYGTLLDVVNIYRTKTETMPECLVMYFALELLVIVKQMHLCKVVHADLKPDNIVLKKLPTFNPNKSVFPLKETSCLCLIDFGQAIDMTRYPEGTTFNVLVKTDGFQCTEMKDGRPWTYQTDLFGVIGTIHLLLFGNYMEVKKNSAGRWEQTNRFKRYWQTDLWHQIFDDLLNIPNCASIPDTSGYIKKMEDYLSASVRYKELVRQSISLRSLWHG